LISISNSFQLFFTFEEILLNWRLRFPWNFHIKIHLQITNLLIGTSSKFFQRRAIDILHLKKPTLVVTSEHIKFVFPWILRSLWKWKFLIVCIQFVTVKGRIGFEVYHSSQYSTQSRSQILFSISSTYRIFRIYVFRKSTGLQQPHKSISWKARFGQTDRQTWFDCFRR